MNRQTTQTANAGNDTLTRQQKFYRDVADGLRRSAEATEAERVKRCKLDLGEFETTWMAAARDCQDRDVRGPEAPRGRLLTGITRQLLLKRGAEKAFVKSWRKGVEALVRHGVAMGPGTFLQPDVAESLADGSYFERR